MFHKYECTWPKTFTTGVLDTSGGARPTIENRAKACADALCAWGNCHAGAGPIPDNFGKGMAAIGHFLGISPTPDYLME
jgi:hypothetical protein